MQSFESKYFLLDMVELVDGTANGIYLATKQVFLELHIPMENIIGYSSDTTNVMFGEHNSVTQMLKAEYPNIFIVKCSCHLIHLVSSYAALKLPKSLEDLCRDIYNHFHRSSKRQDVYQQFQSFFNEEPRKILSPGQTRWLSLEECVNRILEQYQALQHYFVLTANEDPTHANDRIVKSLHNKFTLAYLEFLTYQLRRFNAFNRLFKQFHGRLQAISWPLCTLRRPTPNVCWDGCVRKIQEIQADTRKDDLEKFRRDCRNFLIESISEIKQRFDLDTEVLEVVQCISPAKAASRIPPTLAHIFQKLPYLADLLDVKKPDQEWREHSLEKK